jgi:dUTP pyrophosphatase
MVFGKTELKIMVENGMVKDAPNIYEQIQENGIDFTVQSIFIMRGAGSIGFVNADRVLPAYDEIHWGADDWVYLQPGCYLIKFNEALAVPKDVAIVTLPRSSLIRSGVSIHLGVGDAGYKGRMEGMMLISNPKGYKVKRNARLAQLIFFPLSSPQAGYNGRYQLENM